MERDEIGQAWHNTESNFNSHAHVERDEQVWIPGKPHRHFNSHAHVERDQIMATVLWTLDISTHTLTWSVTRYTYGR